MSKGFLKDILEKTDWSALFRLHSLAVQILRDFFSLSLSLSLFLFPAKSQMYVTPC